MSPIMVTVFHARYNNIILTDKSHGLFNNYDMQDFIDFVCPLRSGVNFIH